MFFVIQYNKIFTRENCSVIVKLLINYVILELSDKILIRVFNSTNKTFLFITITKLFNNKLIKMYLYIFYKLFSHFYIFFAIETFRLFYNLKIYNETHGPCIFF